ncbi:MAG TPA: thioredoxin domain-containing protein [Acidobacteriaceae bacterium]|nr:thioredoxin domain-containing protein [Acidobacteriaceae bacterium]
MYRLLSAALFLSLAACAAHAQTAVPAGQGDTFKDTSMLKPPPGAKVAIIEWEDLECPACAHAFPIVHAAIAHYKIPLIRRDFQIPGHIWSHEASLYARYLEDKVSPEVATDYRRQVFATQYEIASKDDLHNFTVKFFQANHQQIPFVLDPTGQLEREVDADKALGEKLGLVHTPTLIVATQKHWVQVVDTSQLYSVIDAALAQAASTPANAPVHHTTAHRKPA